MEHRSYAVLRIESNRASTKPIISGIEIKKHICKKENNTWPDRPLKFQPQTQTIDTKTCAVKSKVENAIREKELVVLEWRYKKEEWS